MKPQPINPSCSNIGSSLALRRSGRHRVGAQYFVEGAQVLQLLQCPADMGVGRVAFEVDVEVVLPLTGARGRDSNRVMDTPCFFSGTSRSCTAPGRLGTEMIRLVQSLAGRS